jgi:hypothetical protein
MDINDPRLIYHLNICFLAKEEPISQSRILLENLVVAQLVTKLLAFYGT